MKKYCCDNFKWRHEAEKTMGLNIRIIKITEKDVFDLNELKHPYRVFITEGYDNEPTGVKRILISHCPFCGGKLSKTYNKDLYVNEDDHSFVSF